MSAAEVSDEQIDNTEDMVLARQAQNGNRLAWQQLMDKHAPRLCAYIGCRIRRHKLVEKIVADAVFAGWRHISEWSPEQEDFGTWFRKMGGRVALGWRQKHPDEPLAAPFPAGLCADQDEAERMARIEDVLGGLPENQRMALEQHFRAGIPPAAMAKILHTDVTEARRILNAALDAVAAGMEV